MHSDFLRSELTLSLSCLVNSVAADARPGLHIKQVDIADEQALAEGHVGYDLVVDKVRQSTQFVMQSQAQSAVLNDMSINSSCAGDHRLHTQPERGIPEGSVRDPAHFFSDEGERTEARRLLPDLMCVLKVV